eukprot:jgi/Mesen1/1067/ME000123S00239
MDEEGLESRKVNEVLDMIKKDGPLSSDQVTRKKAETMAAGAHQLFLQYLVFTLEATVASMPPNVEQWVWIIDLAGVCICFFHLQYAVSSMYRTLLMITGCTASFLQNSFELCTHTFINLACLTGLSVVSQLTLHGQHF